MKALLVDDHPMVFSELQAVVASLRSDLTLVLAGSADAARSALAENPDLDLVLLDLRSDDAGGMDLLGEVRSARPKVPIVVLTSASAGGDRHSAFVRSAASGLLGAAAQLAPSAFEGHASSVDFDAADTDLGAIDWRFRLTAQASLGALGLTPRQRQVLELILEGQSNKAIARALSLSVDTVKDHVTALMRSLNVSSRTQAVLAVTSRTRARSNAPRPPSS